MMRNRPWLVVRVEHHTWQQQTVGRYRNRNAARTGAAMARLLAFLDRARGARNSFEVWRDA